MLHPVRILGELIGKPLYLVGAKLNEQNLELNEVLMLQLDDMQWYAFSVLNLQAGQCSCCQDYDLWNSKKVIRKAVVYAVQA